MRCLSITMKLSLALLVAWLCSSAARPQSQVSQDFYDGCQPTNWRYRRDVRYMYKYVGLTSTGIVGTSDDMAEIKIEALCEVIPVRKCAYNLKVSEVSLLERSSKEAKFVLSKGSKEFARALSNSPLTFTLSNGRVVKIKSTLQEPTFVANVKRGILSALQLEYKKVDDTRFVERDVSGDCPTRYVKGYREVTKVKNLTECSNRTNIDFTIQPVLYSSNSTRKTLLDCKSSCHYTFDGSSDDIKSVECKETHLFRPFSHQSAGVATSVMQKLTLQNTYKVVNYEWPLEEFSSKISDLRFDFNPTSKQHVQVSRDLVYKTLDDLIRNNPFKETASMKSAKLYTKLVYQLHHMNERDLEFIWMKYYDCAGISNVACQKESEKIKYQQMLVDSFTQCGSEACAMYILGLIRKHSKSVQPEEKSLVNQLLPEMAWIRKPAERVINTFMAILMDKRNSFPKETITAFGSMVRSFCDNNKQCNTNYNFGVWMKFLMDNLAINNKMKCDVKSENIDDVIFTFKAFENIAQLTPSSRSTIERCAQYSNRAISVAALKVLAAVQQDKQLKSFLGEIYGDYGRDPEIRMVAYLTMMKNPSENDVIFALKTLEQEINTQVGSLVWSHLYHMNNSVEPTHGKRFADTIKNAIRRFKKYPRFFNTTQKSRFWQKSTFNEKWNLGMSAESHLIYHPESYLPRSSHFNLTMDILGMAFPLLETNIRAEGFDEIWQMYFGPEGFFFDSAGILNNKEWRKRTGKLSSNDIELDYLDNRINMPEVSPSGLASIKFLGKELVLFPRPQDLNWLRWLDYDFVKEIEQLYKGIDKTFTKNLMFAQESFKVPTCLGLPLDLSLNGTVVGSAKVTLQADLRSIVTKMLMVKTNIHGKAVLKPSAVVRSTGRMSIDATHSTAGVQLESSMFTSTELRANMSYKEGQPLKFHFEVSEKPQELFNMSSSLVRQMNDRQTPVEAKKRCKTAEFCSSSIFNSSKYFGLDWCTKVSVPLSWHNKPLPLFPLTGPGSFSLKMHRVDPKLTTYKLKFSTEMQDTINKSCMQFSTPRASFERIVELNLTSVTKENEIKHLGFTLGNRQRNWTMGLYQLAPTYKKAMIKLNVTLGHNSLYHMMQVTNHSDKVAFLSNMSLSCDKTGRPITVMFLNATYGHLNNLMDETFNLTHHPANFTWQVKAKHSLKMMSTNISCISKCGLVPQSPLLNHNMLINVTYMNTMQNKQMHLNLTVNGTNKWLLLFSKKNISMKPYKTMVSYFSNITMYNRTMLFNVTTAEKPSTKWNLFNFTYQNHSLSFNTTWFLFDTVKNMSLNATYMNHSANTNHSIMLTTMMKNSNLKKSICWNGTYINGTFQKTPLFNSCLVYLNKTEKKSMSWKLTAFNRTHKLKTTWFTWDKSRIKGIKLNYTCQGKTLAHITTWYTKTRKAKNLYLIGKVSNWTLDFKHHYLSKGNFRRPYQNRTLFIVHKIMNPTHTIWNNTFVVSFVNSSQAKQSFLNITLWNETYGVSTLYKIQSQGEEHIHKIKAYGPLRNVSWDVVFKNTSKHVNFSSVVKYQGKKVLNHSVFWLRERKVWNVTVDVLPSVTLSFNSSGTLKTGIDIASNFTFYDNTMLWKCLADDRVISGKVTGWNRTVTLRRVMNLDSISMNLSTWHHIKKENFNGSLSWLLDRSIRKMELSISLPKTSLYLTSFSLNSSHFNLSVIRRNRSQYYKEATIRLLPKGRFHQQFNRTSLTMLWKVLNNKTFHLPAKLVNITLNSTSGGINVSKTGKHLKMMLRNITHVIATWNFTKQNITMNLFNLSVELMNVTSTTLPIVTTNYSFYMKSNKVDVEKFLKNLSMALNTFTESKIQTMKMIDELIWNYRKISGSFNKTAVFGNLTELITNTTWHKKYWRNITLELKWKGLNFLAFGSNQTQRWSIFMIELAKKIGEWKLMNSKESKDINTLLKEYIPRFENYSLYLMAQTKQCAPSLHEITSTLRNITYISEYLISITYPNLHKRSRSLLMNMTDHLSGESCVGGMMHPTWLTLMKIFNISIFNTTVRNIHEHAVRGSHLETVFPIFRQPEYTMGRFHKFISRKKVNKIVDGLLNKTLEFHNMTMRLPSWYMSRTHDNMVYLTDGLVMMLKDTANLMNCTSNKNLSEIISMNIYYTLKITKKTWNTTKHLLFSNWTEPLQKIWEMSYVNEIFSDDALKAMPWMKPIFKRWNTTARDLIYLLKNNTVETHLKKRVPAIVKKSIEKSRMLSSFIDSYLKEKYPRVNITFNDTTLNVLSFGRSPQKRPNFNQAFLDSYTYYQSFSDALLKFPEKSSQWCYRKVVDHLLKSRDSTNQTIIGYLDGTEMVFNLAERFVNGSLVNESMNKIWSRSDELWPALMKFDIVDFSRNYTIWLLHKTLLNRTKLPMYNTWKRMKTVNQKEKRNLAMLFFPKDPMAFVIDQRHVITFDKRLFQFPQYAQPGCTYVITRDFLDEDFTVLSTKISYIIITPDVKIEIFQNGKVRALEFISSRQYIDLPLQFRDLYAIREGPFIRVIHGKKWFKFEFDVERSTFGAYISGFYHNRTMGILGSNNGEVSDDWRSPLGKNRTRVESFFNSWLLGSNKKQCYVTTQPPLPRCTGLKLKRCSELFESKFSPFKSCFDSVNPKMFLKICLQDRSCEQSRWQNYFMAREEKPSHCHVSVAYIRACAQEKVSLSMPQDCESCTFETEYKDVDIVFITSEGTTMPQIAKKLKPFVHMLNKRLLGNNFIPRYGLVGFSGRPPAHWKGHAHTLSGQFFGSSKDIEEAVKTLDFAPLEMRTNVSDGYSGIMEATKYPFRSAKKLFILLTDSPRVGDEDLTSEDVIKAMNRINANLIIIGDYTFKKDLIGGDSDDKRYYLGQPKGIKYKSSERLPETDDYVKVMLKTKGAVFRVKKFEDDSSKKWVFETISNVVLKFSKCRKLCQQCKTGPFDRTRYICEKKSRCYWS